MHTYPVNLDVCNRRCLVVGGGAVAERKVSGLMACGSEITVISPVISESIARNVSQGKVLWRSRLFESSDVQGCFLVFAATDHRDVNQAVADACAKASVLCNIADAPGVSDFSLPAVVRQGDLMISVATSGKSPAASRLIKKELEAQYGAEYAIMLGFMGEIREKLLGMGHDPDAHKKQFRALLGGDLLTLCRNRDIDGINSLFKAVLGEAFSLSGLMTESIQSYWEQK